MVVKNIIRVAEFEKLFYDEDKPFKKRHWDALCHYQEQHLKKTVDKNEYFKILNKGIQFTNYVGVIQAGNLTIEVLPKIDRGRTTAENQTVDKLEMADGKQRNSWHTVLLQMLKECRFLEVNHANYANLNLKSNSILEVYLELFLTETEKLLHEGLIKKYKKTEGNKTALKGQLLFQKNTALNTVHKERFYVRHTEYNSNNLYNQLIYKTLCLIPSLSNSVYLSDHVNRLLLNFPEVDECNATKPVFDQLVFDRKTQRYSEALMISKMLLLNYRPDITGGSENVIAILFDMNELWEEYVYRRLVKVAEPGISVSRQNRKNFWYNYSGDYHKTVRPDIHITKNGKNFILDTKWKIITDNRPADDDLKQMFVYNLLWNAEKSFLIYPGTFEHSNGSYLHFELSKNRNLPEKSEYVNHCSLYFISVLDAKGQLATKEPYQKLLSTLE